MTSQIAVRLPPELVEFVDDEVASGHADSRAAVVLKALAREHRRAVAERDASILAKSHGSRDDFDDLAHLARARPLDHLD